MTRISLRLLLVVALLAIGCSHEPPKSVPRPGPVPAAGDAFFGGVAVADITPPLHLALFGHGPEGRIATGMRLRLRCEVFVLAAGGELVVLIPCDLQSPSETLQRGLAAALAQVGIPVTADRIFLMATHTHAGPGHYFEARRYSGPFSSPAPGYDQAVVDFLVGRMAEATVEAYASLAPVCVGFGVSHLPGLTFNRAYAAFLTNEQSPAARQAGTLQQQLLMAAQHADAQASSWSTQAGSLAGPELAVDDRLFVLRLDRRAKGEPECKASGPPLGVMAVYGMHPTGVPNSNDLYHGDIFGFATRTAATCLQHAEPAAKLGPTALSFDGAGATSACTVPDGPAQPHPPSEGWADGGTADQSVVVGLANGVEGDVSPRVEFQSFYTAQRLGLRLGIEIAKAAAALPAMAAHGTVTHFYRELEFANGRYGDGADERLCPTGELGMASAGGARDGPTRFRVLPEANPGFRLKRAFGCHGYKLPLQLGLSGSPDDFPRGGPIGLVHVAPRGSAGAWLATVPLEVTTMTGLGLRDTLAPLGGDLAVVGLTNQYLQYVATEQEYDNQLYEGASTLYGPHSAQFLSRAFDCMAKELLSGGAQRCRDAPPMNRVGPFDPHPAPRVDRMPTEDDRAPLALTSPPCDPPTYRDGDLGWEILTEPLPATFTADRQLFRVNVLDAADPRRVLDDDRGSSIEVRETGSNGDPRWRVRWSPYLVGGRADPLCGKKFRIAVRGRVRIDSQVCTLTCEPPGAGKTP
jgi:neutral ceramidase